ncbi:CBS domain-containing protein [Candidatus Woesearchaeota archaeon]|nr:CBS domain-containing protein [Candidatus Woesearchaeota archaeon]
MSQSLIAKVESGRIDPAYSKARKILETLESVSREAGLKASDIMHKKVIYVSPDDDVKHAVAKMKKYEISQLPVLRGNDVVGLVSEASILDALMAGKHGKVSDVMQESPAIVNSKTSVQALSTLFRYSPVVLVSKKGRIIGLISKADLIREIV